MKFRYRVFEFTPQLDVELPKVRIEEDECALTSYGAVYVLALQDQDDCDKKMETTLTSEELISLRDHLNHLISLRDRYEERQGRG